jgi:hypothetical protein
MARTSEVSLAVDIRIRRTGRFPRKLGGWNKYDDLGRKESDIPHRVLVSVRDPLTGSTVVLNNTPLVNPMVIVIVASRFELLIHIEDGTAITAYEENER